MRKQEDLVSNAREVQGGWWKSIAEPHHRKMSPEIQSQHPWQATVQVLHCLELLPQQAEAPWSPWTTSSPLGCWIQPLLDAQKTWKEREGRKNQIQGNIKLVLEIGFREAIFIQAYGDELEIKLIVIHECWVYWLLCCFFRWRTAPFEDDISAYFAAHRAM